MDDIGLSKIGEYVSPFATERLGSRYLGAPYERWAYYRHRYTETGEAWHMQQMLSYVTTDNPPDAPRKKPSPSRSDAFWSVFTLAGAVELLAGVGMCFASVNTGVIIIVAAVITTIAGIGALSWQDGKEMRK